MNDFQFQKSTIFENREVAYSEPSQTSKMKHFVKKEKIAVLHV